MGVQEHVSIGLLGRLVGASPHLLHPQGDRLPRSRVLKRQIGVYSLGHEPCRTERSIPPQPGRPQGPTQGQVLILGKRWENLSQFFQGAFAGWDRVGPATAEVASLLTGTGTCPPRCHRAHRMFQVESITAAFLTLPFPLPNFSSRCLRRSDPPGLSPSFGGALQFSARCEHGGGSPCNPHLSPTASATATPSAAAHHRPQAPTGSEPRRAPTLPPSSVPSTARHRVGKRNAKLSLLCIHPKLQDPEVQKHATQILRNMLRQEEAELQVRWRRGSFILRSSPRCCPRPVLASRPLYALQPIVPLTCSALFPRGRRDEVYGVRAGVTVPSRLSAQRFCEAYSRNPGTAVEEQIEGARRRVSQLQLKILQETGGSVVCEMSGVTPGSRVLPSSWLPPSLAGAWGDLPEAVGAIPGFQNLLQWELLRLAWPWPRARVSPRAGEHPTSPTLLLVLQDSGRLCSNSSLASFRMMEGESCWQLGPVPMSLSPEHTGQSLLCSQDASPWTRRMVTVAWSLGRSGSPP